MIKINIIIAKRYTSSPSLTRFEKNRVAFPLSIQYRTIKKKLLIPLFLFFFIFCTKAFAILDLELTQGVDTAIPIAVVPFADKNNSVSSTITHIISSDLQNSGQFKLLSQNQMTVFPSTTGEIQTDDWKNKNLNNLIIGSVKPIDYNRYQINFSLIDLYKKLTTDQSNDAVLIDTSLTVNKNGLRKAGHQIANAIFEKLTGIPGCFDTKIAYVLVKRHMGQPAQYFLMVADADGYQPQVIISSSDPMMSPSWSSDGKHIAYVSFENHRASIYILDVFTGNRYLASDQPGINGAPAWTHDGKQLALVLSNGNNTKIVLLDLLSKKQTPLTDGNSIDTEPSFSPNGKTMVFTSDRKGASPQIYFYNLETKMIQQISNYGDYNARGTLTADMNNLVMLNRYQGQFNVAVQNLQNNEVTVLTTDGNAQSPSVSPNGMMVIYSTKQNKQGLLGLVSVDGRAKWIFPDNEGSVQDPAWGTAPENR